MLGRFWKVKGPGLVLIIPVAQQIVRVDLRTVVLNVPPQDVISRDNVSVKVSAVVYSRVADPERAIILVANSLIGLQAVVLPIPQSHSAVRSPQSAVRSPQSATHCGC